MRSSAHAEYLSVDKKQLRSGSAGRISSRREQTARRCGLAETLCFFPLHKVSTSYPGIYHKNTPSPMAKTCAGRGFEVPIAPTQLSAGSFVFSRFECHARNATPSKGFQGAVRLGVALCFCGLLLMSRPSRGYVCRGPSSLVFRAAFFTLAAHMCDLLLERLRFLPHFSVCAGSLHMAPRRVRRDTGKIGK